MTLGKSLVFCVFFFFSHYLSQCLPTSGILHNVYMSEVAKETERRGRGGGGREDSAAPEELGNKEGYLIRGRGH